MQTWLTLILMMIMSVKLVQLNMKTHKDEVSGNRTHGLNMALLTETPMVLAQLVMNHPFLPCSRTCVLSNVSAIKRSYAGVTSLRLLKWSVSEKFMKT